MVAEICHLFESLLSFCRVNASGRKESGTAVGRQPGSWILVSVGGMLRQRGTATPTGARERMEYGQLTSSSMMGWETLVNVDAEHCLFVKDRSNRRVFRVWDRGTPGNILLPPSSRPQVFSFLLPLLVATTLQSGPEETRPDVKLLLQTEIQENHPSQKHPQFSEIEILLMACGQGDRRLCVTSGFLLGTMTRMEYGHLTSTSMMGQEAPVHGDVEHHPFAEDRSNRLPLCPAASFGTCASLNGPAAWASTILLLLLPLGVCRLGRVP